MNNKSHRRVLFHVIKKSSEQVRVPDKSISVYKHVNLKHTRKNNKKKRAPSLNKRFVDLKSQVIQFYLRDDNSTPAPGIKDFITKKKNKQLKIYLCASLMNMHKKFCKEKNFLISQSLFCALRPFYVVHIKRN